jgi:PAS domain S-box-containing protein
MAHWYRSILDAIPFPISVTDAEGKWTFINTAVEDFLGVQREDVMGKVCSTWGANICNTVDCGIECVKRGLKRTYFSHAGSSYQVDIEILRDLHGETTGFVELVQDITKLEQMAKRQMEAESVSQAKSAFLARVSHEVRTPMNAVLGITEIQLQDASLSQDTKDAFGKIYIAGYTLLGIINDILDLSRMEAGKVALLPGKYEIVSLINDTVQLNLIRLGDKPIEFKLQVDPDMPSAFYGDELRIKQILNNLLSNAFKYTQKGEVALSVSAEYRSEAEESDVTLVCRVSDTGMGMTTEQVTRLLDEYSRFYLEDANRTIEGVGLGMNITWQLVQMMHGEIIVESEPGKGSVLIVRLPQDRIGVGTVGKEAVERLRQFKVGLPYIKMAQIVREPMPYGSVLIVDDLDTNLYVSRGLMAPYGLSIDIALSGFEAINKIRDGKEYDIVFMDHMMPAMDGLETTRILRDMGYAAPIIALTANALVGQAEMFLDSGFNDFISKPVDLRQLDAVLNKQIRDKQPPEVIAAARRQKGVPESVDEALQPFVDPKFAKIFVRDAEKAVATMEMIYTNQYRRDDDMHMFVINVHAMKSALANIGEAALAALAHSLEQAGRRRDADAMSAETPAFLSGLREVIEKNRTMDEDNGAVDEDQAYLRERLLAMQAACATYDKKTIKNALAALQQKVWSRRTREQLDSIATHLLHSDFEEIASVAEQAIRTL